MSNNVNKKCDKKLDDKLVCEYCGRDDFCSKRGFNKHLNACKKKGKREKKWVCEYCGRDNFGNRGGFLTHLKWCKIKHENDDPLRDVIKKNVENRPLNNMKELTEVTPVIGGSAYNKQSIVQEVINWKTIDKLSQYTILSRLYALGYKRSTAYSIIRKASDCLAEIYREWNKNALIEALVDLERQKENAWRIGDFRLVLDITKEENKLKGLYLDRVEVTQFIEFRFDFGLDNNIKEIDYNEQGSNDI